MKTNKTSTCFSMKVNIHLVLLYPKSTKLLKQPPHPPEEADHCIPPVLKMHNLAILMKRLRKLSRTSARLYFSCITKEKRLTDIIIHSTNVTIKSFA